MAQPLRVLVADDNALAAHAIGRAMESWGYEVVAVVGTGKQVIEVARRERLDLVVLDVSMPEGDGLTVARELGRTLAIPVILLSGYRCMPLLAQALDVNVPCLRKPVRLSELKAALRTALDRHRRPLEPAGIPADDLTEEGGM